MEDLNLKELFLIFWRRKIHMIFIIAIFITIGVVYSYMYISPKYQSSTTVILAKSSEEEGKNSSTITTTDITLNQKLISTYSELIKSKNILGEVIRNLEIDKNEDELKTNVSVTAVKDTELIKISVTDEKPEIAQIIASEIADVFIEKVANGVYNINNVQVWDKAEIPTEPSNINHKKDLIMFTGIGVVMACIYILIINMLDTTVKSKEDLERKLNVSVLTTIPICNFDDSLKRVSKGGKR